VGSRAGLNATKQREVSFPCKEWNPSPPAHILCLPGLSVATDSWKNYLLFTVHFIHAETQAAILTDFRSGLLRPVACLSKFTINTV
jgi:hypothetical protein